MRSYLIPRDVGGETRILFFTPKAFLYTIIGVLIGTTFKFILGIFSLKITGIVVLLLISLIAFLIGIMKVPDSNAVAFFKDTGGENIDDIIWRYVRFIGKTKAYLYYRKKS